ncbi:MAG TPA: hypothetical protein DCY20_02915 [Firmicutes bacterium]|nr:hypothetical protein [Bacillota bacterium]
MRGTFQTFLELDIDKSVIGLQPCGEEDVYFCTPLDAVLIGALGVDGVHFCFIPSLHQPLDLEAGCVYAVSPMNADKFVYPVASNFIEFLSLVVACRDASPLELVSNTSLETFNEIIISSEDIPRKVESLNALTSQFELLHIPSPYDLIKSVQEGFNHSIIPTSDEYADVLGRD